MDERSREHEDLVDVGRPTRLETDFLVDCGECRLEDTDACADCVVSVILQLTPTPVAFDADDLQALDHLAEVGLAPPVRMDRTGPDETEPDSDLRAG